MKRSLLLLVLLGLLAGGASAANVTLSVTSQTIAPGGTVAVPIAIAGASSVGAMDLTVTYDPAVLKYVSADLGSLSKNGLVEANGTTGGTVRIAFVDTAGVNGDGPIIALSFTAVGAAGTSSKVDVVARGVYTLEHVDVPATTQAGTVTVGGRAATPLPAAIAVAALFGAGLIASGRRKIRD